MSAVTDLAAGVDALGSGELALVLGIASAVAVLVVTAWAGHRRRPGAAEFFTGGRLFTPLENGLATAGGYPSAASFLGVPGLVALVGYDGLLYPVGLLVAWLVVLLLVAELVRNCGRYTLADVLSARMRERPVRLAAGTSSVVVSVFCLAAQMVGAGALVGLLLGGGGARTWTVVGAGALVAVNIAAGGMRAATWIQIAGTVLLTAGAAVLTGLLLARFHGDLDALLEAAARGSGHGSGFLRPGLAYGGSWSARADFVSLALALVLGAAGLPHILARFCTVPTARSARRSVIWSAVVVGVLSLMTAVLGFGAAALVGTEAVRGSHPSGNTALPLLALDLGRGAGGTVLLAVVAVAALAAVLAVAAGLTLASSASFAHDLWATVVRERGRRAGENQEVSVARASAVAAGAVAIALSVFAQRLNVVFLVGLAFAVAASANLPALVYSLFWRRFTTRGTVWAVYGGLASAVLLVAFSPVLSGSADSIIPGADFHWFPLRNPGIVSIPLGFLSGWLGTVLSRERPDPGRYAEMEVRALTGAGAV